jgi:hypothetical protein
VSKKIAVYRSPGPHFGPPGKTYDCKGVEPEELDAALLDGWHESFLAALGLEPVDAAAVEVQPDADPESADDAPPTRAEMLQQANLLGIKVDRRWNDETLLAKINAAMAAPAPADEDPV